MSIEETRREKECGRFGTREKGVEKLRKELEELGFSLVSSRWPQVIETPTFERRGNFEAIPLQSSTKGGVSIRASDPEDLVARVRQKVGQIEDGRVAATRQPS
jgi:hypothetical protein